MPSRGQLALGVFVAVQAQLGVVRKVGAELEEERAEVAVHCIEIVVVDHGRGLDDPRVGLAGAGAVPLLGAEDRRLFLGLADEDDAFLGREAAQPLGHHIILALAFVKQHQRNLMLRDETVQRCDKLPAHRVHQRGGS